MTIEDLAIITKKGFDEVDKRFDRRITELKLDLMDFLTKK